mmetsp:Transcript_43036/g.84855  ORF Transcript_43036/g.84855 Transcript_43036/m.84855 type:complete len:227 (-) Transcript_43036:38-718(-)
MFGMEGYGLLDYRVPPPKKGGDVRTRFASVIRVRAPRGSPLVGTHVAFPSPIGGVVGQDWWVYHHEHGEEVMEIFVNGEPRLWIQTSEAGWMKRSEFDQLCELGVVANGKFNSWRVPGLRRYWSVWVPSLSARALEGFNVKTFLEAMKRPLECPVPVVVEMASSICLLALGDGKMCAVYDRVSAGIQKCFGCYYTRYCSHGCQKKDWRRYYWSVCPTLRAAVAQTG